jgi:SAM-dependent methyltransferase
MKQEKIWEYFQGEGAGIFLDSSARLDYLFRHVEKVSRGRRIRILNIGVGNGWLERRCLQAGMETCSIDPNEKAIAKLIEEGVSGKVGYIEEIPFADRDFDAVFCSEVLEHLSAEQYQAGLREVWRVLKEGGLLAGTVPYKEDFPINMAVCPSCGNVFHRWGQK